jgi:hypothetical protein
VRLHHLSLPVAALAATALAAVPAQAGGGVTLGLKGGSGNRTLRACGIRHHYTLYRPGARIAFDGTVAGAAGSFAVKVKVKRCVGGRFADVSKVPATGKAGRYRGVLGATPRGLYFARTTYRAGAVLKSDKQYFKVG